MSELVIWKLSFINFVFDLERDFYKGSGVGCRICRSCFAGEKMTS